MTFERYLLRWQPAVGFPRHPESQHNEAQEVQLQYNYNLVAVGVVAFHREAAFALLPHTTGLDFSVFPPLYTCEKISIVRL